MATESCNAADASRCQEAAERDRLVLAVAPQAAFDGWGRMALVRAAQQLGIPLARAEALFPDPAPDLITWRSRLADREMVAVAREDGFGVLRTPEKLIAMIRRRFAHCQEPREAGRRAAAFLALPLQAPLAARLLLQTVDALWVAAGDRATDWRYYSKRARLAAIYAATMLVWLQDRSDDGAVACTFFERRLAAVATSSRRMGRARSLLEAAPRRWRALRAYGRDAVDSPWRRP